MVIERVDALPVCVAIGFAFVEAASAGLVGAAPVSASPVADGLVSKRE